MNKEIEATRDNLKHAAQHECAQAQPLIATLDRQLKGWAKADEADKSVLRPQIEANIKRLEKARAL